MKIQVATCKANKTAAATTTTTLATYLASRRRGKGGEGGKEELNMAWHIPMQSKIFYFHTLVGPNPRNIADRYFYMNIHKHMNTHRGVQRGKKGCQKLLAKWGKSAKIATRITVKIIIEISSKKSECETERDRQTDCHCMLTQ